MDIIMSFIFGVIPIVLVISIALIAVNKTKPKVKINDNLSNKYKEMAYALIKNNEELDKQRKTHNLLSLVRGVLTVIFVASFFLILVQREWIIIIVPIIAIIILIILGKYGKNNLIFSSIIPNIIKEHFNEFEYDHNAGIDRKVYSEARFETYDRYHSDDLITGKVCGFDFSMSEVHTERRHRDKNGHTYYTTIFRGAFSKVTLTKDINCFINIINNRIKLFSRDYYTTIDNEAFEKIYDVFTDDKIKALRLLTPDVTTKMIDLYNETGIYCEVKITNDILYIRLHTGALFNFSFSNPEKEALMVGKSIAIIDSVFKVMENFVKEVEEFDV